ncbi:hypothetical protein D3C81_1254000 [compost metagenome]
MADLIRDTDRPSDQWSDVVASDIKGNGLPYQPVADVAIRLIQVRASGSTGPHPSQCDSETLFDPVIGTAQHHGLT